MRRPPRLAAWLLDRLGYTAQNPALAGDLLEEFRFGRSTAWFWRQTAAVIGAGVVRNARASRWYLLALLAGFAAQAPLVFGLSDLHLPSKVHGVLWVTLLLLAWLLSYLPASLLIERVTKRDSRELQFLLVEPGGWKTRAPLMALAGLEQFVGYLVLYLVFAALLQPSQGDVVVWEVSWLALGLGVATVRVPSARQAAERPAFVEPRPVTYFVDQLSLRVTVSDGRTILLTPETVAEAAFASADEELIAALFGGGSSLETARRAIRLACGRYLLEPPAMSVAELASLAREARGL